MSDLATEARAEQAGYERMFVDRAVEKLAAIQQRLGCPKPEAGEADGNASFGRKLWYLVHSRCTPLDYLLERVHRLSVLIAIHGDSSEQQLARDILKIIAGLATESTEDTERKKIDR